MSILINKNTRVIVQGITGKEGTFHTKQMLEYGTNIVAGITPGKGGLLYTGTKEHQFEKEIPVYNKVIEAVDATHADTSIIFVPAPNAPNAIIEAIDAGISLIVVITEGIPVKDTVKIYDYAKSNKVLLIGPNSPGIITPGESKVGIMPAYIHTPGRIGIVSRSGTLTYEAVFQLTGLNIGQSTCVGIGGDPVTGMRLIDVIKLFNEDTDTDGIVIIGEIGGNMEEESAEYIKEYVKKPVIGYIAGHSAPSEKRMGHAGAIILGSKGSAQEKEKALSRAGVTIVKNPTMFGETIRNLINKI